MKRTTNSPEAQPQGVDTRIRTATIRICQACVDLAGEECHTPECVFCFRSVTEAKWLMDKMMIAPIIDGERFVLVDDERSEVEAHNAGNCDVCAARYEYEIAGGTVPTGHTRADLLRATAPSHLIVADDMPNGWKVEAWYANEHEADAAANALKVPRATGETTAEAADGIAIIAAERCGQIEREEWTPEHDDEHKRGEMAIAAACYAVIGTDAHVEYPDDDPEGSGWPWGEQWFKPKDDIRNLARAGALIAAEIDRLRRAAAQGKAERGDATRTEGKERAINE